MRRRPDPDSAVGLLEASDWQLLRRLDEVETGSAAWTAVATQVLDRGREFSLQGRLWNPMLDAIACSTFSPFYEQVKPLAMRFEAAIGPWLERHAADRWEETLLLFRFTTRRISTTALQAVPQLGYSEVQDICRVAPQHVHLLARRAEAGCSPPLGLAALKDCLLSDLRLADAGPVGCGRLWCPERRPSPLAFDALRVLCSADLLEHSERSSIARLAAERLPAAHEVDEVGFHWRRRVARWVALRPTSRITAEELVAIFRTLVAEEDAAHWGAALWSHFSCTQEVRDVLISSPSPWQEEFVRLAEHQGR
jgi:hypothetical protein